MAKKTKAELVEEGKVLTSAIADIRKGPHNFALLMGSDAVHLAVHKTKSTIALKTEAKTAGGNAAKGALGIVDIEGKTLKFTCAEGEDPPAMLGRKFKIHLKERGLNFKVMILDFAGKVLEGDEEDDTQASGDAPTAPSEDGAQKDLRSKLEDAFNKFAPLLKQEIAARKPIDQAPILGAIKAFKDAMAREDYADALKKLTILREGLISVAKPSQIDPGKTPKGKVDKAALLEKAGQVDTVVKKALGDRTFFVQSASRLRDLRNSFKQAIADDPSEEELAKLKKMKEKLDDLFLEDLKFQGHGPQRHEGAVTPAQLSDRAKNGINPQTGTKFDDVARTKPHGYGKDATRFTDPGAYVDAEEFMRNDRRTVAAKRNAIRFRSNRIEVIVPLKEVLGDDYKKYVEGKTRTGSRNHPTGSVDTNLENCDLIARYQIARDGSMTLITMFPNPK
ncbi:hypothetical protein EGN72_10620 [Pseudorhodobacter sp. E13]|uniref:hypothetical protein n=1 Tax=Pseudorhodobacter sp. E13 TaxID=2487931 RepID=UPI000F8E2640|nr:hypothetical protein [Pseudorhodobacter sp. E13]RUS60235.1 hypothetical protein EGN72_10620 [Pseudorhodobacter sp. E13]